MKTTYDLSTLNWTLAGWTPYMWRMLKTLELGESPQAELRGIRATVPGSVQQSLRNAGLLPDWNLPGNDRLCEWVENRHRISLYRELGANTLRVWGGSYLEKEVFYNLCDEHGLLVWQDLMLSSSGIDNVPPSDPVSISEMGAILRSFIARCQHHAALLLWCGGNELHEQAPEGYGRPMTVAHPLLAHLRSVRDCSQPLNL